MMRLGGITCVYGPQHSRRRWARGQYQDYKVRVEEKSQSRYHRMPTWPRAPSRHIKQMNFERRRCFPKTTLSDSIMKLHGLGKYHNAFKNCTKSIATLIHCFSQMISVDSQTARPACANFGQVRFTNLRDLNNGWHKFKWGHIKRATVNTSQTRVLWPTSSILSPQRAFRGPQKDPSCQNRSSLSWHRWSCIGTWWFFWVRRSQ